MIADPNDPATQSAALDARRRKCCNPSRQQWCSYHEGYMDGYDKALEDVRPLPETWEAA